MTTSADDFVFASYLSDAVHTESALDDIAGQMVGDAVSADLVTVFITPHHISSIESILDRLEHELHPKVIIGCTAEGVIGQGCEVERKAAMSVLVGQLPGCEVTPFRYEPRETMDLLAEGEPLGRMKSNGIAPRALLLVGDPFSTPINQLLPQLDGAFGGIPVVGGMASGANQPGINRLVLNRNVYHDGAIGVSISGPVDVHCTISQGCRPIGKPLVITKAKRHVVLELGGHKALSMAKQTVEGSPIDDQEMVMTHGLQIGRVIDEYKSRFGRGDFLVRAINGVDMSSGAIGISDPNVRVGQTVQFHVRDRETARDDFAFLLEAQKIHGPGAGALLFTCNGRGTRLFEKPNTDVSMVAEALGDIPLAGFFAAGELGPVGQQNYIHAHTACLMVFRKPE